MSQKIEKSINIKALSGTIWEALTVPGQMVQWMAEPGMDLEILTAWEVGSPIIIRGRHNGPFTNRGKVLAFQPDSLLSYNYLSSISRLPDVPKNHTVVEFRLKPEKDHTVLVVSLTTFPETC